MRLILLANSPLAATGYGTQAKLFLPQFKAAGHDVACIAFYGLEGACLVWSGIMIYPRYRHQYGMDIAAGHTLHHKADVMLSLMDAWVMEPSVYQRVKWIPWIPIDHEPIPKPVAETIRHAYERVTMSRFGERMAAEAGIDSTYIPHGFAPEIFHPRDKAESRAALGWPQDTFIAAIVAANKGIPSRKAFPQQFEAFSQLAQKHNDVMLYVHSNVEGNGGYQLADMAERYGIVDKTTFVDPYEYILGYPEDYLAQVYSAADVLLHVSTGEGFGITGLESQACGTPVITGNWTAMPEILRGGWMLDKSEAERFLMPIGSFQWLPHPAAIAERLEVAYMQRDIHASGFNRGTLAADVGADYAVDVVMEKHWNPFFEKLERRLTEEKRLYSSISNGATPQLAAARA